MHDHGHLEAPSSAAYIRLLEKWYRSQRTWVHPAGDRLAFYGTGDHSTWSVQANSTAIGALAVLAVAPEFDEKAVGAGRDEVREVALSLLRYLLATHRSGRQPCVSGQSWGNSWITVLGLERMNHGINLLRPWLCESDLSDLKRVMVSEADFLIDGYPTVGAIDAATKKNKPESNIWNASFLYRIAMLWPDLPNAARYRERSTELFLNGISIPSDADRERLFYGKPLKDWHVGPNFTENFGLHHHGYLNVGYMVICLSNIAMAHYSCLDHGIQLPEELYHHAKELWQVVKSLTFDDGRLWRIGGDTRVRYCYCQDYAIPAWLLARDLWGDHDAARFLAGWLPIVEKEQGDDGAFLSERLAGLARLSPLYYCRLEGDRAVTLSQGAHWMRRAFSPIQKLQRTVSTWSDEFHGAAMVSGKRRRASWVWKASRVPSGTVIPADRSDLVEWQWNLAGRVHGTGCMVRVEVVESAFDSFEGGFLSNGSYHWVSSDNPSEGSSDETTCIARIVCVALPDDATVIVLQQVTALKPTYLNEVIGLHLNVPNDCFNDGVRSYRINGEERAIPGAAGSRFPLAETIAAGTRIGIEGRMEVQAIYGGGLSLRRPGRRNVNLATNVAMDFAGAAGNLYCDLVCLPFRDEQTFYQKGETVYDIGAATTVDGESNARLLSAPTSLGKLVEVHGKDGNRYWLAANLSAEPIEISLPQEAKGAELLSGGKPGDDHVVRLRVGGAALLRSRA